MPSLKLALFSAKLIGLRNAFRAIANGILRNYLERRYMLPPSDEPRMLGKLLTAEKRPNGAHFQFEWAILDVQFLDADFLCVEWDSPQPLEAGRLPESYGVARREWTGAEVELTHVEQDWRLRSTALELQVSLSGGLRLLTSQGRFIRRDLPLWRFGHSWLGQTQLGTEACIYGLGERAAGRLNLRPGRYYFWNLDCGGTYGVGEDPLYLSMPVYLCLQSNGCHLAYYDNTFEGSITLGNQILASDSGKSLRLDASGEPVEGGLSGKARRGTQKVASPQVEVRFEGGPERTYIAVGSPADVLERFTALTGRLCLPPRWALGFQQSRWGYATQEDLQRVYDGFLRHDLPLSVLYLDADHMEGYRTLRLDKSRYPSLNELAQEMRARDIHLVASTNPAVKIEKGLDTTYEDGLRQGVFCTNPDGKVARGVVWPGWVTFTDFTKPEAREWWGKQYARQIQHGFDGFWHDMNEPANFVGSGELTPARCMRHDLEGRGGTHQEAHNVYGLLMNQAGYEGLRRLQPDKRPFILTRSGWVGVQRHAVTWTGDVETSWEALRQTIPTVLGMGLCGAPISGPDIGGFSGAPTPELFIRWFQLASFLPFFRTHCAFYLPRREPWEFGEEALKILRQALKQRYRLLPYWYSLTWQNSQSGTPIVRPLFWDDSSNPTWWEVDDAFTLGEALLVAPILEEGANRRALRLPPGGWYELDNDRFHSGSTNLMVEAPLDRIPVLARSGSIIPVMEEDGLKLHIYHPSGGEAGRGLLYSDLGDGFGSWRVDRFTLQPAGKAGYELLWDQEGEYPWEYGELRWVLHGFEDEKVKIVSR